MGLLVPTLFDSRGFKNAHQFVGPAASGRRCRRLRIQHHVHRRSTGNANRWYGLRIGHHGGVEQYVVGCDASLVPRRCRVACTARSV